MSVQTMTRKKEEEGRQAVPDYLIYEIGKGGKPIYYKGYKDVLNKTKTFEEILMESKLQAWLKTQLSATLINWLSEKKLVVVAGELGINLPEGGKRGADLSIFREENWVLDEHFSDLPPDVIIEIDIKADTENTTEMDYVLEKIEDYLNFSVKKVIWIFTKTRKVMVATKDEPWLTHGWNMEVEIIEDVRLNLQDFVGKHGKNEMKK